MNRNFISQNLDKILPSATLTIASLAAKMKENGRDIISLSTGEPDFDTPFNVKKAAIEAIEQGKTKYTATDGVKELKIAIQEKLARENSILASLENIIVSSGAKQVIYNLFLASLNPGDEVIIPAPYWVSYPDIVTLAGGKPVIIDCLKNKFKLTPDLLQSHITDKTKWIVLNYPSNPTGAVYNEGELEGFIEVLRNNPHIALMSDEIYEHIIYEEKFYSIAALAPDLSERIVTVNGVSKSYAMTGWRIGYAAGPRDLIAAMSKLQSQSTSNPTSISQYAAIEALNNCQSFILENKKTFLERRDVIVKLLNEIPFLKVEKPSGSFYVFADFSAYIGKKYQNFWIKNDKDLAQYLLEAAEVAAVPGEAFGACNHLRFSYSTSLIQIKLACSRIKEALAKLS